MAHQRRLPIALLLATCSSFLLGCGTSGGFEPEHNVEYGKLPRVSQTHDPELENELARLIASGGTPELLSAPAPGTPPIPDDQNAAVAMKDLFSPTMIRLVEKRARKELFPQGRFQFNPIALQEVIRFCDSYDEQRMAGRTALSMPQGSYRFDFMQGLLGDTSFVETARICIYLEAFKAAELLHEDKPYDAVLPLSYMFRHISLLSKVPHVVPRIAAVHLRRDALRVLEEIVRHPKAKRDTLERLHEILLGQLSSWPADADAWIGDRAIVMHTYEIIRDGQLTSVLTMEEIDQFKTEGNLKSLFRAVADNIDGDQLFYLQTMRKMIDACELPFYQRTPVFQAMYDELKELAPTAKYPMVAARVMLPDIKQGQRLQARDRAYVEAWTLALANATGRKTTGIDLSPLTGKKYRVITNTTNVSVWGIEPSSAGQHVIAPIAKD